MKKEYLYNLTALRGVAALFVVIHHFDFFMGALFPNGTTGIIYKFYLMVDLFFILSGFVICYVYGNSFRSFISTKSYKQFIFARLARVYPLHIFTLLAEMIVFLILVLSNKYEQLSEPGKHIYRLDAIPVQLAFLQTVGIYNFDTWNAPSWSLSTEWWAYVLFPIIFILLWKSKKRYSIVIAAILAILGWLLIEYKLAPLEPFMDFPPNPKNVTLNVNWHYGTIRGITGFMAGMVIWHLFINNIGKRILANGWALTILAILSLIWTHYKMPDTVTVFLYAFIILSAAYGSNGMDHFFSWKPLQKLGQWSFSLYMWHMFFLEIIRKSFLFYKPEWVKLRPFNDGLLHPVFILVIILPILFLISWASYRYVEKPSRVWLKMKLINK